ncbi:MAG TPA: hypothetical protein VNO52_14420, partial [Methylomirabilota bacterium]|nr:hypothetical protein [Methylomirabilota bacterium]
LLKITAITRWPAIENTHLNWNAKITRYYAIQTNSALSSGAWGDLLALNLPGWNNHTFFDPTFTNQFYRIRAYRPLLP